MQSEALSKQSITPIYMWNRQVGAFSRKGDLYQRISVIGGGQFQVGKHCIPGSKKGHGAGKKSMAPGKKTWRWEKGHGAGPC